MISGWTWRHRWRVWRMVRRLAHTKHFRGVPGSSAELARATGMLPIYSDIGGTILLSTSGELAVEDHSTGRIGPLDDPTWGVTALVLAARCHPELADLRPVRPEVSADCSTCSGAGRFNCGPAKVWCGECFGTGWTAGRPVPNST